MAQVSYYFDAHYGRSDIDDAWIADANAFNGDTSTYAYVQAGGDPITNALRGVGTTAPSTSDNIITLVEVRAYVSDFTSGVGWSSYTTLSAPTGGWTWAKLEALTVDLYLDSTTGWDIKGLVKSGSDSLATANFYNDTIGESQRVYKVEVRVTYDLPPDPEPEPEPSPSTGRTGAFLLFF